MFVCEKCKMFRISEVNVSEMTFRISFRIFEMLFGFVMTLRLTICQMFVDFHLSRSSRYCEVYTEKTYLNQPTSTCRVSPLMRTYTALTPPGRLAPTRQMLMNGSLVPLALCTLPQKTPVTITPAFRSAPNETVSVRQNTLLAVAWTRNVKTTNRRTTSVQNEDRRNIASKTRLRSLNRLIARLYCTIIVTHVTNSIWRSVMLRS